MRERGANADAIRRPLRLRPSYDAKTWGGRRLERYGKALPPGCIGESLESGSTAVVDGGLFDGVRLGDLAQSHASALLGSLGRAVAGPFNDFPLLVKLIDAGEDLSIQVHPDDAGAPEGKRGKSEAWVILDAAPGASLVTGVDGHIDLPGIARQIVREPVEAGQVFLVPAGTVHAIGAGVLLYEIQQASDVTWRLYDWGRPREIHVQQALAAARPAQRATRTTPLRLDAWREMLVACRYFALERWRLSGRRRVAPLPTSARIVTAIDGGLLVDDLVLPRGATAILPADIGALTLDGDAELLVGYAPDIAVDVVEPLRSAGYAPASIRALGLDSV
jgi:mannose-6-phosphate isomerase